MQNSGQQLCAIKLLQDADSFAADVAARYTGTSATWSATAAVNRVTWLGGTISDSEHLCCHILYRGVLTCFRQLGQCQVKPVTKK